MIREEVLVRNAESKIKHGVRRINEVNEEMGGNF